MAKTSDKPWMDGRRKPTPAQLKRRENGAAGTRASSVRAAKQNLAVENSGRWRPAPARDPRMGQVPVRKVVTRPMTDAERAAMAARRVTARYS